MADHRAGKGQILSADQLADRMAVPCFYILTGRATPAFPYSSTPGPSAFVQVIRTGPVIPTIASGVFPATLNWRQWRDVIVPFFEEGWEGYLGFLGGATSTTNFGIPTIDPGRGIFNGGAAEQQEMVNQIRLRLVSIANDAGYA